MNTRRTVAIAAVAAIGTRLSTRPVRRQLRELRDEYDQRMIDLLEADTHVSKLQTDFDALLQEYSDAKAELSTWVKVATSKPAGMLRAKPHNH